MEATLAPVAEQFAHINPQEFGEKVNELWRGSEAIKDSIVTQVEEGLISPLTGAGMVACVVGQQFGYQEFHRELTPADLLTNSRSR